MIEITVGYSKGIGLPTVVLANGYRSSVLVWTTETATYGREEVAAFHGLTWHGVEGLGQISQARKILSRTAYVMLLESRSADHISLTRSIFLQNEIASGVIVWDDVQWSEISLADVVDRFTGIETTILRSCTIDLKPFDETKATELNFSLPDIENLK